MTIFAVKNASELTAALANAQGGDRIEMSSGNYGDVAIKGKSFASNVTITAQDSSHPPVFNTINILGSSNLVFDGIEVDFHPTLATKDWTSAFQANSSSGIQILNSTFVGGDAIGGIDPNNTAQNAGAYGVKGFPIGIGMKFMNSSDITIDGNKMTGFTHSVKFVNVDNIALNNNEISDFRKVPVSGSDLNNVHLEGNYFHDPNPWNFGPSGDHGDFVHFWTTPKQIGASQNFVFKDNFFDQGNGKAILGIYLDDNTNNKGFTNVLIEDNIIHNGNGQAIRMEDVVGLTIRDNTILGTPQNSNVIPKIILDNGTKNVLIDNNIYSGVGGNAAQNAQANNIVFGHNVTTQITDSSKPDYAGYIFSHGVTAVGSLSDFDVVAGSIGAGMGAHISGLPTTPSLPSSPSSGGPVIVPTTGQVLVTDTGAIPAQQTEGTGSHTEGAGTTPVVVHVETPMLHTGRDGGSVAIETSTIVKLVPVVAEKQVFAEVAPKGATPTKAPEPVAFVKVALTGDTIVVEQQQATAPIEQVKGWAGAAVPVAHFVGSFFGGSPSAELTQQIDHFAVTEEHHFGRDVMVF